MRVRLRAQVAARIDDSGREPRCRQPCVQRDEVGGRGKERVHDAFILFRFARAGRVHQPPARSHAIGRVPEHRQLGRGEGRQIPLVTAPANVGIAAQRAEAGARRIDQHAVEGRGEGQRLQQIGLNDARVGGATRSHGSAEQVDAPLPDVARDEQTTSVHQRRERRGLAAWRCAGVEHRLDRTVTGEERHELRCFVLDDKPPLLLERSAERMSLVHHESVGCKGRRVHLNFVGGKPFDQRIARRPQAVGPQRHRARRVVEPHPGFGAVETEPIVPALREPARMRERDAEVQQCRSAILDVGWTRRQRQRIPPARDRAQHRIHEAARTPFARPLREVDGIVHHGGRGHARQVEQLIGAESQDFENLRVEAIDSPFREFHDEVVEGIPPSLDSAGNFRRQRAIAFIGQARAGRRNRRREVGPSGRDGAKDVVRRKTRRRDHGAGVNRSPTARRWPARNSRAFIGRLPSAWISRRWM